MNKKTLNTLLVGAAVATMAGGVTVSTANAGPGQGKEKCYGVAKAGHNDCGNLAKTHSCAGQSTVDRDPGEWIAVPAGLCNKLAGGKTAEQAKASHDGHGHKDY